jgi:hypothetical protein
MKRIVDYDLLCNMSKVNKTTSNANRKETEEYLKSNDNDAILRLIKERLKIGFGRYGKGLKVEDSNYDYLMEGREEILDMAIYFCSDILRQQRARRLGYNNQQINDDNIVDDYRKRYLKFLRN